MSRIRSESRAARIVVTITIVTISVAITTPVSMVSVVAVAIVVSVTVVVSVAISVSIAVSAALTLFVTLIAVSRLRTSLCQRRASKDAFVSCTHPGMASCPVAIL